MSTKIDVRDLVYRQEQGGQFRWITVTVLLVAVGEILHLISPSVAGITPSWPIAAYCAAIMLTRPTYRQTLGIGLAVALLGVLTSKSAFPYGNLAAEPVGALACCFLMHLLERLRLRYFGKLDIGPVILTLITTVISGAIFITILWQVMGLDVNIYLKGMWPIVLIVAVVNAVAAPLMYYPAKHLFAKRGLVKLAENEKSDHSNLELKPSQAGKISVEHLTFSYDAQKKPVLEDINLAIQEGDFMVITGPAGCGKSTLCMALTGAVPKFYGGFMKGMVFVDGLATTQVDIPTIADHIGVVLADYDTQLVTMTVQEEVAFALENRGYQADAIKVRTAEVLAQVGLTGMEERAISSLSGGQRQRLAIASVLATNPSILVLDEPTSSLDPEGTEELYRLVGALNKDYGITVVVIDHDLHAILPYANRMVLLVEGRVACDASLSETLQYMYEHNIYTDALPSLFKASMDLRRGGVPVCEPWLTIEGAKAALKSFGGEG